jgi:hypothetical protein
MAREKNFTKAVQQKLCRDVGGRCSNPDCRDFTFGAISLGEAAHITAASPGGARYDRNLTDKERHAEANGIWLCRKCHALVDRLYEQYTVELLREWKRQAIEAARREMITGRLDSSVLANLELRLICTTANAFRDEGFELEVQLVNTGNKSVKLDPPYVLEITIPREESISHNIIINRLIQPAQSLPVYYFKYPIQRHPPNAEIIIKLHYPNEKSLEVKKSIHELFEEARRLQGERLRGY